MSTSSRMAATPAVPWLMATALFNVGVMTTCAVVATFVVSKMYHTFLYPVGSIALGNLCTKPTHHHRQQKKEEKEEDEKKVDDRVFYIRGDHGSKLVYREIYEEKVYFQHGISLPKDTDQPLVVVDAGSNIGLFARFILQRFPTATVYCVEPMPDLVEVIRRNTAFAEDRVRVSMVPLGRVTGQPLEFEFNANLSCGCASASDALDCANNVRCRDWLTWAGAVLHDGLLSNSLPAMLTPFFRVLSSVLHATAVPRMVRIGVFAVFTPVVLLHVAWSAGQNIPKKKVSCSTKTLEDVLYGGEDASPSPSLASTASIDLLKIDIEGAELDVLQSLSDATWSRVKQVVVETQDISGRIEIIRDLLKAKGFTHIVTADEEFETHNLMGITSFFAHRG
mmetsp:Transcript_54850/g.63075  ORF Transcript_54850/g.63075 Transcript_54850/m.63075 type:complete len:393 (-) Transcript_54850:230-1408(-)